MQELNQIRGSAAPWSGTIMAALAVISGWMIFLFAPQEVTMGDVQRIVYLHVSVAWCGLAGCIAMGVTAGIYLATRQPLWDQWSQAAGELGWLCTTLTLATGSLWAHEAWNTWWTWEPRLTASLVLWLVFTGYFLVRSSVTDPDRRARVSAVLAILALTDVPLVILATRWFRGIHPVTPEMDPRMRLALLISVLSYTAIFGLLAVLRRRQLDSDRQLALLERKSECSTNNSTNRGGFKHMVTLTVAYIVAWGAVSLYVSWLGLTQRRLVQRIRALEAATARQEAARQRAA